MTTEAAGVRLGCTLIPGPLRMTRCIAMSVCAPSDRARARRDRQLSESTSQLNLLWSPTSSTPPHLLYILPPPPTPHALPRHRHQPVSHSSILSSSHSRLVRSTSLLAGFQKPGYPNPSKTCQVHASAPPHVPLKSTPVRHHCPITALTPIHLSVCPLYNTLSPLWFRGRYNHPLHTSLHPVLCSYGCS